MVHTLELIDCDGDIGDLEGLAAAEGLLQQLIKSKRRARR
jgi:hypothetical protein